MEKIKSIVTITDFYDAFVYIPEDTPGVKTENNIEPNNPIWVFTDKQFLSNTQSFSQNWILDNRQFFKIEYEKPEKELIKKYIAVHIEYETNSEITGENIERALATIFTDARNFKNFKVTVWRSGTVNDNLDPMYMKKNMER